MYLLVIILPFSFFSFSIIYIEKILIWIVLIWKKIIIEDDDYICIFFFLIYIKNDDVELEENLIWQNSQFNNSFFQFLK